MSRRLVAGLVVALALTASSTASAQLGGLVKKKAKEKAAEAAGVQQPSTDQPARLPGPEVTPAALDRLLTAFKAEKTARDNWAANEEKRREAEEKRRKAKQEQDRQEALAKMDPQTRHQYCISEKMQTDPDNAKLKKLSDQAAEASKKGDNGAMMQISLDMGPIQAGMQQRADSACAAQEKEAKKGGGKKAPSPEQAAVEEAPPNSPEEAGAKAGGFTDVDYAQLKELVLIHLRDPKRAGLTDAEKKAVEPKKAQLTAGLKSIGQM
jgi:hypothetical protein